MNGKAMKKTVLFLMGIFAMALVSCKKSNELHISETDSKLVPYSITVSMENTKTSVASNKVTWSAGDEIVIASNATDDTGTYPYYILKTENGGASAVFTGLLPDGFMAGKALYPKEALAKVHSATNFKLKLNADQTGLTNSVSSGSLLLYSNFTDITKGVTMHHAHGLLKLSVAGNDVTSISLTSNTFLIQDDLNFNTTSGNISAGASARGYTITLSPESGKTCFAPGDYYFGTVGKTGSGRSLSGLSICYVKKDGSRWVKSSANSLNIVDGAILNLGISENDCTKQSAVSSVSVSIKDGASVALTDTGDGVFEGNVDVPAEGQFSLDLNGVPFGYVAHSGAGGVGTCCDVNSALPIKQLNKAVSDGKAIGKKYTVRKSLGSIVPVEDKGCLFWINNAASGKMYVKCDTENKHYYLKMVETPDANVIMDETFDLLVYGGDYLVPCQGWVVPSDPWGASTADNGEYTTPQFNGASYSSDGTVTKELTLDFIKTWEVENWCDPVSIGYRPHCIQFGSSTATKFTNFTTPKFSAISGTSDILIQMDLCRFAEGTTNPLYIVVEGAGTIVSGSMTVDYVEYGGGPVSENWDAQKLPDKTYVVSDCDCFPHTKKWNLYPNGSTANHSMDKPVTHFTIKVSGATAETYLRLHSNENGASRYTLYSFKVTKAN